MKYAIRHRSIHVRWIVRSDMPEVLDIEHSSFEFPWTEEDFIRCLQQRSIIGMVAELDEMVAGYMVYAPDQTSLHLVNIAVDKCFRRRGVGRAMVDQLKVKLSAQRRRDIIADVREMNFNAQVFYRAMGFRAVQILRDHYRETNEDAYRFRFRVKATF